MADLVKVIFLQISLLGVGCYSWLSDATNGFSTGYHFLCYFQNTVKGVKSRKRGKFYVLKSITCERAFGVFALKHFQSEAS